METQTSELGTNDTSDKRMRIAGSVLSGLAILFMGMDGVAKLFMPPEVVEGTVSLGFPASTIVGIGVAALIPTILYAVPRTALLGAVLLTGYLGGAVATHVRVLNPWASHILFPGYVAAFIWGGLLLREPRLRALFPIRTKAS